MRIVTKKILSYVLQLESRLILWKYKPKIIAITGSVGKTSTKDAVYAVLSKIAYVRKSDKSYNSELGLPLTILGCPNGWNNPMVWTRNIFKGLWLFIYPHRYPEWLVLEVGVGKPNDMHITASWLQTDAVIMTAIGETPAHIEFFESKKHLIEEKSKLIKTLKPDGFLILNADDENVISLKSRTKNRIITFGFSEGVDVMASTESILYEKDGTPAGMAFRVDEDGRSLPVIIEGVFGKNHIYTSLGALALSSGLKFNILNAIDALKNYDVPPGRMRLLRGINHTLILDDTYNSSPIACESALMTLGGVKSKGRKVAVLGDMLELGRHTEEAHKNIGAVAKDNVDALLVVGLRARAIAEGARVAGMDKKNIVEFTNSREAGEYLKQFIHKNDFILIKGSQGMRMERAVEAILEDQEHKSTLLVRQDVEWLKKE